MDPEPIEHETADFKLRLANGVARFELKAECSDVEAARSIVEPFVIGWQMSAALDGAPGNFEFRFESAELVDPGPSSEGRSLHFHVAASHSARLTMDVQRRTYPPIPAVSLGADRCVSAMMYQYELCRRETALVSQVAYFCLTVMEEMAGRRSAAAQHFDIERDVLQKVGELTSERGGARGRKAEGLDAPYTPEEEHRLDRAIRLMIRRTAERVANPTAPLRMLRMSDLPTL